MLSAFFYCTNLYFYGSVFTEMPQRATVQGLEEELLSLYLGISQEHGYRFPRLESGGDCMAWDQAASYDLHMRTQGF